MAEQLIAPPLPMTVTDVRSPFATPDLRRFTMLVIPLALLLFLFKAYRLEQPSFFSLSCLVFGGFAVSYWLPLRWKETFLILLSFAGACVLLGPLVASMLIGIGLTMFAIARSGLDFRNKVLVLLGLLAALAWGRTLENSPVPDEFWPVFGAIFMFRMIVYMYEKLSDGLHRYNAPSERSYYSASAITSHGYFLLQPDIVFQKREPGLSVADCVTAAVKKVLEKGAVDEHKIGIVGHSWGGFDASFLATHTTIFAAAVAGAPITDLISNYGNHHWSSGIAETDHIETGQQRMEVPLYEDLQAYIRNSAVFGVQTMTTPLLIEVGDADGTVFYHQGIELYNIARRAKKNVVLLVYGGEDHGLRKKADQVDYQRRIFAWFGYYLKGEAAPAWVTEGESYLDHQRELKKTKSSSSVSTPPVSGQ